MDTALAAPGSAEPASELAEARAGELRLRRRTFALELGALGAWAAFSTALTVAFTLETLSWGILDQPLFTAFMFAALSISLLSPLGLWAMRTIHRRHADARMALYDADDPTLDALPPALRALASDARLARDAVEAREHDGDMAALRAVWEWSQRLAELPEADRRALDELGLELEQRGVGEALRWTIANPEHGERGLARIAEGLRSFEQGLLRAREPYR